MELSYCYHPSYDKCDLCGERNYYNMDIWNIYSGALKKYIWNTEHYSSLHSSKYLRMCARCAFSIFKASLFNAKSERDDTQFIHDLEIVTEVLKMREYNYSDYTKNSESYEDVIKVVKEQGEQIKKCLSFIDENLKNESRKKLNNTVNFIPSHENILHIESNIITTKDDKVSEMEIIFLLGRLWKEISKEYSLIQIEEFNSKRYPDAVISRKNKDGSVKKCITEFESFSSNFLLHSHPIDKCDIIICWKHDWNECPQHIEVIELCNIINNDKNKEMIN